MKPEERIHQDSMASGLDRHGRDCRFLKSALTHHAYAGIRLEMKITVTEDQAPLDYDQDQVAQQYQEAKQQLWRSRIEEPSLMRLIGDLRGKRVIDAACGEGYFTRRLRQAGAAEVVGFDISERMIELARSQEAHDPLGIAYRVEDARTVVPQQSFDLVVSAWLLVHAQTREELQEFCDGIASRLRPGGRFVTLTTNPDVYFFRPRPDYRKYGFEMTLAEHVKGGAPIRFTMHLEKADLEIVNYYLPLTEYQEAFRRAGFRDFQLHPLHLAPDPAGRDDRADWEDFLKNPIMILFDCVKAE
ncbi:class I SAM-dependent methyltransferase [Synechococcus sp. CBW1006]|uniref:class I SAM-dependent methyltransferase n=1 Tax=Synechococcus sp. CBW1006 TaxID=1353138 RepID=UPI0018CDC155|nr:class I SAM-dependent methyltransferase [Synechococcus sp. CBW1006]